MNARAEWIAGEGALWLALCCGPIGWALNTELGYAFASDACRNRFTGILLGAAVSIAIALLGLVPAWAHFRSSDQAVRAPNRFLAKLAAGASCLFAFIIAAQAAAALVFDGCERW
jgi:hypothetical protein